MSKAQYKVLRPTTIGGQSYERGEELVLDEKDAKPIVDAGEITFSRAVSEIAAPKERAADRDPKPDVASPEESSDLEDEIDAESDDGEEESTDTTAPEGSNEGGEVASTEETSAPTSDTPAPEVPESRPTGIFGRGKRGK